jgi:hypothetical protein
MAAGAGIRPEQIRGYGLRTGEVTATNIADGTLTTTKFATSIYAGTPTAIDPDDAGAAGTGTTVARGDHQHAIVTGTPASGGTANAEGAGTGFARDTHVHDIANGAIDAAALFAAGVVDTAALAAGAATATKRTASFARVRRAANQALTTAVGANISFDTEEEDTDAYWAAGSPTQFTIPASSGAVYNITCTAVFEANATGSRSLVIVLGGLTLIGGQCNNGTATDSTRLHATTGPIRLAAADVITFSVVQRSGGNLNIQDRTIATIERLGA